MKNEKNKVRPAVEKMSDEKLSKKLGRLQAAESLGISFGVICLVIGTITAFTIHNRTVFTVLFFVGVAAIIFLGLCCQKKKKALINQQLGDFFNEELQKAFGDEPSNPQFPIDRGYLEKSELIIPDWEECTVSNFREGVHNGTKFSAANVQLRHSVEEKSGPNNDNWMTRSVTVFEGVVIRCGDVANSVFDIVINDTMREKKSDKDISEPAVFLERFTAKTADGRDAAALIRPEIREMFRELEKISLGRVCGFAVRGGELSLALGTKYIFANIPNSLDARDIDGMRKWYKASLEGMGKLLDIIKNNLAPDNTKVGSNTTE